MAQPEHCDKPQRDQQRGQQRRQRVQNKAQQLQSHHSGSSLVAKQDDVMQQVGGDEDEEVEREGAAQELEAVLHMQQQNLKREGTFEHAAAAVAEVGIRSSPTVHMQLQQLQKWGSDYAKLCTCSNSGRRSGELDYAQLCMCSSSGCRSGDQILHNCAHAATELEVRSEISTCSSGSRSENGNVCMQQWHCK